MVISCNCSKVDDRQVTIKVRKTIIITYLKTWFLIDLISVFPISQIVEAEFKGKKKISGLTMNLNNIFRLSKLYKLIKLLKLLKLVRLLKVAKNKGLKRLSKFFEEKMRMNHQLETFIILILGFILLNHIVASLWVFLARLEDFGPSSWVARGGFQDSYDFDV